MSHRKFVFSNTVVRIVVVVEAGANAETIALSNANAKIRNEQASSRKQIPILTSANRNSATDVAEPFMIGVTSFSWK